MEYDFSDKAKGFLKNQTSDGSSKFWGDSSVGDKVVASLKNKAKEHNEKHPEKVTLEQLKKVYRRGAAASSSGHRPGKSMGQWAMARVNMFLRMKGGSETEDSYKKTDQDPVSIDFSDLKFEEEIKATNSSIFDLTDQLNPSSEDMDQSKIDADLYKLDYDFQNIDECQKIVNEWTTPYARTDETHSVSEYNKSVPKGRQTSSRAIEVGQIFYFGTKYSDSMGAHVSNTDGSKTPVHMGSHGIGVSRLVGAIIEASHDDNGIIWPEGVTPFHVGIVNLKQGDDETDHLCSSIYKTFTDLGFDCLYDDREERAGTKFAAMDLIGLPWRITVGPRGIKNGVVELTSRRSGISTELSPELAIKKVTDIYKSLR